MPPAPRGLRTSRPSTEAGRPRETAGSRPTVAPARPLDARPSGTPAPLASGASGVQRAFVIEPQLAMRETEEGVAAPRFQIFIIDAGWNSAAHKVLRENFGLLRDLQKGDPIYVLSREKSIEYIRRNYADLVGKDPIIAVHDLDALGESGTAGFHGFRLHLGLLRTEEQALLALQTFSRFLGTHRQSVDLEAEIRRKLRREGIIGAIEIILDHEPREIGG